MLRSWNIQTGLCLSEKTHSEFTLIPFGFSKNGQTLVTGLPGGDLAQLWNAKTGRLQSTLRGISVANVAFSSNGKTMALGGGFQTGASGVQLRDSKTGLLLKTPRAAEFGIDAVAFSSDGKTVAGAAERVRLWDMVSGKLQGTLPVQAGSLAFSPDNRFIVTLSSQDNKNSIILWNRSTCKTVWSKSRVGTVVNGLIPSRVAFSPDGRSICALDESSKLYCLDVLIGKPRLNFSGNSARLTSISFANDGKSLFIIDINGVVQRRSLSNGARVHITKPLPPAMYLLDPSSGGTRLASSGADGLQFRNAVSGKLLATLQLTGLRQDPKGVSTDWIAYTPDGFYDASPESESLIRWRVGDQLYPADKYKSEFNRPDLILRAMGG